MKLQDLQPSAEAREGKWFTFEHEAVAQNGDRPLRLLIRSTDVPGYRLALDNALRRVMNRKTRNPRKPQLASAEEQQEAELHALARHVLMDFDGIEDTAPDGAPLEGSRVEHRELLLTSPYIREFVLEKAEDAAAFREAERGN